MCHGALTQSLLGACCTLWARARWARASISLARDHWRAIIWARASISNSNSNIQLSLGLEPIHSRALGCLPPRPPPPSPISLLPPPSPPCPLLLRPPRPSSLLLLLLLLLLLGPLVEPTLYGATKRCPGWVGETLADCATGTFGGDPHNTVSCAGETHANCATGAFG